MKDLSSLKLWNSRSRPQNHTLKANMAALAWYKGVSLGLSQNFPFEGCGLGSLTFARKCRGLTQIGEVVCPVS